MDSRLVIQVISMILVDMFVFFNLMVTWVILVHIPVISHVNKGVISMIILVISMSLKVLVLNLNVFIMMLAFLGDCNKCIESAFGDGSEICSISMISARISWMLWLFEHFRCWFLRFQWILVFVSMISVASLSLKSRW